METFQKLTIVLPEKRKSDFFNDLKENIEKSQWKIRNDLVLNYKKNTFTNDKEILCIESDKLALDNKTIQGLLWIWDYRGYYEVFNIVPVGGRNLEKKEYNYIINRFLNLFIVGLEKKYDAKVSLTKPEKLLVETIGQDAYKALTRFSTTANKSTGNTHDYDFEKWCDFVFIVFKNDIHLSVEELVLWFIENGWDDEMSTKLGLDFEYSINLLEKYEQN